MAFFYDTGRFSIGSNTYSKSLKEDLQNELSGDFNRFEVINLDDPTLSIKQQLNELKRSKVRVALLSSSVRTNSVVVAIAKENAKLPKNERLQLLGSMSFSHQDILSRGGAALEGTVISAPCIPYNSAYMKNAARRWEAKEVNWRVTTSYDATKSLIQAIHLSEEPSRQSILTQLRSLNLPAAESSGFGVVFSDSNHDNVKRNYCLFERRNFQLQEIIPIKKDPRD